MERKPTKLDAAGLGRPGFWIAFIVALAGWAMVEGFATLQVTLAAVGCGLAIAVQLGDDQRRGVERRIREAMVLSGHSIKSVALAFYGDERRAPDVEKALGGERPLDLARLEILLGDEFARHFATLTLIEKGPPTYIRKALKVFATVQEGAA